MQTGGCQPACKAGQNHGSGNFRPIHPAGQRNTKHCANRGNIPVVNILNPLLDNPAHAQADAQNGNGETPLILAAREGNNEFVSLLVEHGANVNLADNLQHTALYYASERGYNEITEILLTAGAEG